MRVSVALRSLLSSTLVVLWFAYTAAPVAIAEDVAGRCSAPIPGEYLVKFKGTSRSALLANSQSAETFFRSLGMQRKKTFSAILPGVNHVQLLDYSESSLTKLKKDPSVDYLVQNCRRTTSAQTGFSVTGTVRGHLQALPSFPMSLVFGSDISSIFSLEGDLRLNQSTISPDENSGVSERYFPSELALLPSPGSRLATLFTANRTEVFRSATNQLLRSDGVTVFGNRGDGFYDPESLSFFGRFGLEPTLTTTSGVFNDGSLPAVIFGGGSDGVSGGPGKFQIYFSVGDRYVRGNAQSLGRPVKLSIGDMSGNKLGDIVALSDLSDPSSSRKYYVEVIPYLGDGRFGISRALQLQSPSGNASFNSIALGDVDEDGRTDVIVGGTLLSPQLGNLGLIQIYSNHSAGSFTLKSTYQIPLLSGFSSVKVFDVDNDGHLDIVGVSETDTKLIAMKNVGLGEFKHRTSIGLVGGVKQLDVADFDGDGYDDLILTDPTRKTVYPMINRSSAIFLTDPELFSRDTFLAIPNYQFSLPVTPRDAKAVNYSGWHSTVVRLTNDATGLQFVKKTDFNGYFKFVNLPRGSYSVIIDANGVAYRAPRLTVDRDLARVDISAREDLLPLDVPAPAVAPVQPPNDPGFNLLWGLHNGGQFQGVVDVDMDVPEAWRKTKGDRSVIVAVMDSGIDIDHPDLAANIYVNSGEIPDNRSDDDGNGYVDDVQGWDFGYNVNDVRPITSIHGTHVSGTIAAVANNGIGISGVAPNVRVLPLAFLDGPLGGSLSAELQAFDYVARMKQRGVNIKILSGSFGGAGPCSLPEFQAIEALNNLGILTVFSAGNESGNLEQKPTTPATCKTSGLVAVAAVDRRGALANFSNFGPHDVHVAGPGVEVMSTFPFTWGENSRTGYGAIDGTSMATPNIAGIAALILSVKPSLLPAQVRQVLMESIKPLDSLKGKIIAPGIVSASLALAHPLVAGVSTQPSGRPTLSPKTAPSKGGKIKIIVQVPKAPVSRSAKVIVTANRKSVKYKGALTYRADGTAVIRATIILAKNSAKKLRTDAITVEFSPTKRSTLKIKIGGVKVAGKR